MPIYEFLCRPCNTIFSFLVRHPSKDTSPVCPRCGKEDMQRVMSKFSVSKSTGDTVSTEDMDLAGLDEEDPRAMARAIRGMADEMGEELEPEVMEALTRLESGEDPERIEHDLQESGFGMDGAAPSRDNGLYEA